MPFAQRVVTPIYMSRNKRSTSAGTVGKSGNDITDNGIGGNASTTATAAFTTTIPSSSAASAASRPAITTISDYELEAVTNLTLSNALRQLASLVLIANDIFTELNKELHVIGDRTRTIKLRIDTLDKKVDEVDPKLVTVPESDLATFAQIKNHFKCNRPIYTSLFTPATRSENLQHLYDAAAKTPVNAMEEMDRILGQNDRRSSDIFICTPVLGQARRRMKANIDVEIETRMPAAVEELRKWTSSEAIGDTTVTPHCITKVGFSNLSFSHNNSTLVNSATNSVGTSVDVTDDTTTISRINEVTTDMPLDHRLPSPEEQCQMIALRFPAELIKVDTSGKRFERMCTARKSMNVIAVTISDQNNLNDDIQTVKRRSRSRKPRHKRRNTIAGTDQKEIEEAVKGDDDESCRNPINSNNDNDDNKYVPRSKSNDILKKDSPTSTFGGGKSMPRMSHFNTLKQWGRNRLRLINRNSGSGNGSNDDSKKDNNKDKVSDIDDINVYETVISKNKRKFMEKERKLSHERKPSYSSSEKSLTIISSNAQQTILPASINPVKLRESSALRRQRRSGLGHKDEPNSSSGNWSASSESGRTSIGSEITTQPKSSASSTSLNHSHHPSSGPPSSIISRRRFLNTSASSSVTSEGTVTPDMQVHDSYDDETSSAYSCDTEGYYTSFHVDSGLKTLKEEEPVTPLHTSSALSSTNSFGSSSNKTVLSAENEYELFGKGSTSTTASSAGTVCTTLMAANSDRSLVNGPAVPERKSSLTKLHRSNSNASNSTLERSCSSSTVGSTLERTGTIKRNGILIEKKVTAIVHDPQTTRIESPDSGNNTSSSPIETNSNSSPIHGVRSNSEYDYSECSDLEGVERVERIRVKTTINSSRIPSLCVITPSNSDDDDHSSDGKTSINQRSRFASPVRETNLDTLEFNSEASPKTPGQVKIMTINKKTGYATVNTIETTQPNRPVKVPNEFKKEVQHFKKATLLPLNNMFGKLRGVLPHLKKSPVKDAEAVQEPVYDNTGEYVTISDVANNNNKKRQSSGYYSNDVLRRNLATVLSGNLNEETEYISLNELPTNIRCESNLLSSPTNSQDGEEKINNHPMNMNENDGGNTTQVDEEGSNKRSYGARVTLDAQGKVVYSSDSLKRRKGAHTTFVPGPCVKNITDSSSASSSNQATACAVGVGGVSNRKPSVVRPVISQSLHRPIAQVKSSGETSKQTDKIVIRAADTQGITGNAEIVRMPVATVIATIPTQNATVSTHLTTETIAANDMAGLTTSLKGAYVNIQTNPVNDNSSTFSSSNKSRDFPIGKTSDYQRLSHDDINAGTEQRIGAFNPSTLPRIPIQGYAGPTDAASPAELYASPFQRSSNIYWTLQPRKQPNTKTDQSIKSPSPTKDDIGVIASTKHNLVPIEDLYSTPNKIKNKKNVLRPTPLGFSTFFSPVTKLPENSASNETSKISPIDPRNTGGSFQTSTPSKSTEDTSKITKSNLSTELRNRLYIQEGGSSVHAGSHHSGSSSPSSGRSTPRMYLEPQSGRNSDANDLSQTCLDRLGTPKTSLMDFKKLLLSKATKASDRKSAVELLRLSKETPKPLQPLASPNSSAVNILDLSGSPKTFATRRMIRQGNFGGSPSKNSPSQSVKHMSPRSAWKFNNYRTDVMSTAIPEVNSEEDSSPNNSTDRQTSPSKRSPTVVEENIDIKDNIFLQAEENNFMKSEQFLSKPVSYSRAQLSQARAQFLQGDTTTSFSAAPTISAQFKNGHYMGTRTTTKSPLSQLTEISNVGGGTQDDSRLMDTQTGTSIPSLETAL